MSPLRPARTLALLCSLGLALAPRAASAQSTEPPSPPSAGRAAEADALVQQGVAQRRAGQDQLALESFRRAFAIVPAPRTQAQIALAEQALGQWADADRDLRAALGATSDDWIQRNRAPLEAALNSIASRMATLDIVCTNQGARLLVNGREVGAFPLRDPVRVETGTVALEVRLDGYRTVRRAIDVEGGRSYRESFTLIQTPIDEPDDNSGADPRTRTRVIVQPADAPAPPLSWALLGGGVALAAGGVAGHVYWQNRVSLYNSNVIVRADGGYEPGCFLSTESYPTRSARCGAILSESWAGFGLAVAGYALGAAAFGAGLYVRFTHRPAREAPPPSAPNRGAAAASTTARNTPAWTCAPTLGVAGAQCLVQF